MRIIVPSIHSTLAALATLGLSSQAAAQDNSPSAPPAAAAAAVSTVEAPDAVPSAPAPTPAPPPPSSTAAAPPAAPTETVPAASAVPAAPAAEAPKPIPSYFRIDHDYMLGLQLWAGATYPLTDSIGLATDIYIAENYPTFGGGVDSDGNTAFSTTQSYWGEFDIGPAFTIGKLSLTPMVGVAFDWAAKRAVAINGPQLYTIFNHDKIYFESWVWTFFYSAFKKDGPNDYIHTRNWVLYKLNDTIALGPQLEYSYDLEAKQTIFGFPVGGHVELSYGTGNSLGLFLGYDTKKATHGPNDTAAVGRLSFVHNF